MPTSYESMQNYIETALPAESPIVYGMHPNAELSLLTSQVGDPGLCISHAGIIGGKCLSNECVLCHHKIKVSFDHEPFWS